MRKIGYLFILIFLGMCGLSSCEKNNYDSYPPTWKGFEVTDESGTKLTGSVPTIHPGQKITVRAVQDEKGRLINATNYYWKLIISCGTMGRDTIYGSPYPIHTNYDGTSNADPEIVFSIPTDAKIDTFAVVQFDAAYSYSGNGIFVADNKPYNEPTLSGNIRSTSSTLAGKATGNTRLSVKQ